MKISVITITYNCESDVEKTIKSVVSQDYPELEYIIIDGKSVDKTLSIVAKYEEYITKIVSEKDSGISDAFNKGIKCATGDIICIINAGDTLLPHALKMLSQEIEEGTEVLFGNGWREYKGGHTRPYLSNPNLEELYQRMSLVHPATFVRKSAYEKYGNYNTEYRCVMDRELLLRMLKAGAKFQYSKEYYVTYAMGGISDRKYVSSVVPEDYRISIENGMLPLKAYYKAIQSIIMYYLVKIRNRFLRYE